MVLKKAVLVLKKWSWSWPDRSWSWKNRWSWSCYITGHITGKNSFSTWIIIFSLQWIILRNFL